MPDAKATRAPRHVAPRLPPASSQEAGHRLVREALWTEQDNRDALERFQAGKEPAKLVEVKKARLAELDGRAIIAVGEAVRSLAAGA